MMTEHQAFKKQLELFLKERPDFFESQVSIICGSAPGRLDVMGGIADYSGSMVLELPIDKRAYCAIQKRDDQQVKTYSANGNREADIALEEMNGPIEEAVNYFKKHPENHWASYCLGAFSVLKESHNCLFSSGLSVYVWSEVPEGKGVSSSAALEVAFMRALCSLIGLTLDGREMAFLCQKVENLVAGAPCGIMDQATSIMGEANHLLPIHCQPCTLYDPLPLPDDLAVWGLDSGIRHSVGGADYGSVRAAAFMGYRIIAEHAGFHVEHTGPGLVRVHDPEFDGYLANISPEEFDKKWSDHLPLSLSGEAFLARYHGITDPVSTINANGDYRVLQSAGHPIYENDRTRSFIDLLHAEQSEDSHRKLGSLMLQSHMSYGTCGLGSPGTDRLVELAMEAGPDKGVFGAKISGGGSGGTVVVLALRESEATINAILEAYRAETDGLIVDPIQGRTERLSTEDSFLFKA